MTPGDDDLSTPLHAVTFCVVDLETTGGSPASSTITEVGAATFRGGERLGTFQTLVNPGTPVPPEVAQITGITDAMLRPAPTISQVLPSLVEFAHGAVLVGHNLRFDTSFLDAALAATGRSLLDQLRVDTVPLARRLVRGDVPDCKLGTLAFHLGLPHQPTHRALDDVLATADLLHFLLERAAAYGVTALDDLLALPGLAAHPHADKLRLTVRLPRGPGAYLVRNRRGEALHAGHADDVRTRVRSYFSAAPDVPTAGRRSVNPVLREAHVVEHLRCGSGLEAAVAAARLARVLVPRHDERVGSVTARRYVTVTRAGRLAVARRPRPGTTVLVGPVASTAVARQLVAAVEAAAAPMPTDDAVVGPAPTGTADDSPACPPGPAPGAAVPPGGDPAPSSSADLPALVGRLVDRGDALAAAGRFAAAALARQHAAVLAEATARHRRVERWREAGRVVVGLPGGGRAELVNGCLVRTWHPDRSSIVWADDGRGTGLSAPAAPGGRPPAPASLGEVRLDGVAPPGADGAVPPEAAAELDCVAAWFDGHAGEVRLLHVEGELSTPLPAIPPVPAAEADDDEHQGPAGDELALAALDIDGPGGGPGTDALGQEAGWVAAFAAEHDAVPDEGGRRRIEHELGPLAGERNPDELVPYLRQLVDARAGAGAGTTATAGAGATAGATATAITGASGAVA